MLAVTVHLRVRPSAVAEFEVLAAELWRRSHASEPGLRRYEYVRRPEPGSYLAHMLFDDHEAFIDHQASDHHVEVIAKMRDLLEVADIEFGQPVDGAFGGLPGAPAGPLEVDEQRRHDYAERYQRPEPTWWHRPA